MKSEVRPRLAAVELPDFGEPATRSDPPAGLYAERLERVRERMADAGFDRLVIYADREHSANLAWLTGFDPRFEEAIAIIGPTQDPAILVGNESWGTAGAAPLPMRRHLHQDLSLPSQPRDRSRSLREVLAEEGLRKDARVGVVGLKSYGEEALLDVPSYLADEVRSLAGGRSSVRNAVGLFIDAATGLRVTNEPDQLAAFESAACLTSSGVRRLITGLAELAAGDDSPISEREAVALLGWDGSPLSCHLMLTAGPRARFGLLSPSDRPIRRGDPLTVAFGIWGALNCRAGFVVTDDQGLPEGIRDYVDRLVAPYFGAIAEWYGALRIGQKGSVLHEIVARRLGDPFFGIFLNPGHQISLDEWVNSPIGPDSSVELQSGMYLQVDVIPATGTDYFTTNIEDGVALADTALRADLAARHPAMWDRIQARRAFMNDALGIELHPDVLPFSNISAWLPPYLLDPTRAMVVA